MSFKEDYLAKRAERTVGATQGAAKTAPATSSSATGKTSAASTAKSTATTPTTEKQTTQPSAGSYASDYLKLRAQRTSDPTAAAAAAAKQSLTTAPQLNTTVVQQPTLAQRIGNVLSGAGKLYGLQAVGVGEWLSNVEEKYQEAREAAGIPSGGYKEGNNGRVWGTEPTAASAREQAEELRQFGSGLKESGAADVEKAKQGLGKVGSTLVDIGVAGTQMLGDVGIGVMTGGGAMLPMVVRSFGGGVQQAREKGYNVAQQTGLGLANAATEYFTEKLFGGNPAYDTDIGLVNKLVERVAGNGKLISILSSLPAEVVSEGLEEVIGDILEPISEKVITGNWTGYDIDQIINDGIVGMALGGIGQGGQYVVNKVRGAVTPKQAQQGNATPPPVNAQARQTSAEGNLTPAQTEGAEAAKNAPQGAQAQTPANAAPAAQQAANVTQQGVKSAEEAFSRATPVQERLNAQLDAVAKELGIAHAPDVQKSVKSILSRMGRDGLDAADSVKDLARGHLELASWDDIPRVYAALNQMKIPYTATAKNTAQGYKGLHLTWNDGGVGVEVQLTTPEAWAVKQKTEETYAKWRDLSEDQMTDEQFLERDADYEASRKLWETVQLPNFGSFATSSADSGDAFQRSLPNTGRDGFDQAPSTSSSVRTDGSRVSQSTRPSSARTNLGSDMKSPPSEESVTQTPDSVNKIDFSTADDVKNDSLGSARGGFDPYSAAENRYGTQDGGEKAVRPDDAPVSTNGKDRVSRSVVSAKGAAVTPDDFVPLLEKSTMNGDYSYIPITNNATTQSAMEYIEEHGWEDALRLWRRNALRGKYSPTMNVVGQLLYNNAANSGDTATALDIFADYQATLRNSAQILQSSRVLKNMTPANRLYMIQKSIDQFMLDAGVPDGIKLSNEVKQRYLNAKTEAERDAVIEEMQREVARQLPSTALDKWNALRYVNMLGNFKTQVRNVAGNVGMQILSRIKDGIATGLEGIAHIASGGKFERTKALLPGKALTDAARADFADVEKIALGESKYSLHEGNGTQDFMSGAQDMKTVFKFGENPVTRALGVNGKKGGAIYRTLEAYRKATDWAMEKGDVIFSKSSYAHALAGYLKAHGVTAAQFTSEAWHAKNADLVDTARAYAIREAQEATFRDTNAVSGWISKVGRRQDTPKWAHIAGEGLLPFRKTPANVAVRAEEYSPLGLINTAVKTVQLAKGAENVTGADVINQLSKSLTGTGVFALGMWLRSMGLLRGGDDEDKNQEYFDDLKGHQNYAIESPDGGWSYTFDWFTPGSIPLFMGAEMFDEMEENGLQFSDVEGALTRIAEPMLEMSMLSGVNDVIDELKYGNDNFGQLLGTMLVGYATQGLTNTLLGQLERISEPERMSTYVDKDSPIPAWLQRQIGKASAKTPKWDYQQYPYIDALGRHESSGDFTERAVTNLFSPGYLSHISDDKLEQELQRVADQTGNTSIFPDNAAKYITVDGKTKNLTQEEYQQYATTAGRAFLEMANRVINGQQYDKLTDEEKADAFSKIGSYASAKAKQEITGDDGNLSGSARTVEKADEAARAGIDASEYFVLKYVHDTIDDEDMKPEEKATRFKLYLDGVKWLSDEQREVVSGLMPYSGGFYAEANDRALSAVNAGTLTMDEYYDTRKKLTDYLNGENLSKSRLVAFLDANFPKEKRRDLFELYQGGGDGKNKWKNPY